MEGLETEADILEKEGMLERAKARQKTFASKRVVGLVVNDLISGVYKYRVVQMGLKIIEEVIERTMLESRVKEMLRELEDMGKAGKEMIEKELKHQRDECSRQERLIEQRKRKEAWVERFWKQLEDEIDLEEIEELEMMETDEIELDNVLGDPSMMETMETL